MSLGERIRDLRNSKGLSAIQLGKMLKPPVGRQAIYHWEVDRHHPSPDYMRQLVELLDTSYDELLQGSAGGTGAGSGLTVMVVGAAHAGRSVESVEWPEKDRYSVQVPNTPELKAYQGIRVVGFVVRGTAMNLVYPHGTLLLCAALKDLKEDPRVPKDGSRYIIRKILAKEQEEVLVMECQSRGTGAARSIWLWPRSSDPAYQTPINLMSRDSRNFKVSHRVVYSFRPEP